MVEFDIPKDYAQRALEAIVNRGACTLIRAGIGLLVFEGTGPSTGTFTSLHVLPALDEFSPMLNAVTSTMIFPGMAVQMTMPEPGLIQFDLGKWTWNAIDEDEDEDDDEEGGPFTCRLCGEVEDTLDGYDGMCGACADKECADAEQQEQQDDFKTQDEIWAELYLRDYIASLDEKEDNTDA